MRLLILLLISFSSMAQTIGEIKTMAFDATPINDFLRWQTKEGRTAERVSSFKVDPKLKYNFWLVVNISKDDVKVLDGEGEETLPPASFIVGESIKNILGEFEVTAPFVHAYSPVNAKDLYVVYSICNECKYKPKPNGSERGAVERIQGSTRKH